jgi:hypothetical protein
MLKVQPAIRFAEALLNCVILLQSGNLIYALLFLLPL